MLKNLSNHSCPFDKTTPANQPVECHKCGNIMKEKYLRLVFINGQFPYKFIKNLLCLILHCITVICLVLIYPALYYCYLSSTNLSFTDICLVLIYPALYHCFLSSTVVLIYPALYHCYLSNTNLSCTVSLVSV